MELIVHPRGEAEWRGRRYRCALGHGGVRDDKREGDGATPAGDFGLLRVLYRADRLASPTTVLPVDALASDDGWCDTPGDAAYNRQVKLPYKAGSETLWRDDGLYDVIAVSSYNDTPAVPGRGSAIFVHVARDNFEPTEGCVAFTRDDLLTILREWAPGDLVRVLGV